MKHNNDVKYSCRGGALLGVSALALLAAVVGYGGAVQAGKLTVIYAFRDIKGISPQSDLTADGAGNLYGTASGGGANGFGVVYELSPPPAGDKMWSQAVLHDFGGADGAGPVSGLINDGAGNLYGTTPLGGQSGAGVVYELRPPVIGKKTWTQTVLHAFDGADGAVPGGTLVADGAGDLYGITAQGGANNDGVVFELSPPLAGATAWTETVLHSFHAEGTAPDRPVGGVVLDSAGNLYGATEYGGAQGVGVVYELIRPQSGRTVWVAKVRHSFDTSDGQFPMASLVADSAGNLYGTTMGGGANGYGVVFELSVPLPGQDVWKQAVLFSFDGSNGGLPTTRLLMDDVGDVDGTTPYGGQNNGGVAYRLSPPKKGASDWTQRVLKSFDGTHGKNPAAGLTRDSAGALYGTTQEGGAQGVGIAFKLEP
jgi:uncharacterized repeat protein (TIGR03803 family)